VLRVERRGWAGALRLAGSTMVERAGRHVLCSEKWTELCLILGILGLSVTRHARLPSTSCACFPRIRRLCLAERSTVVSQLAKLSIKKEDQ